MKMMISSWGATLYPHLRDVFLYVVCLPFCVSPHLHLTLQLQLDIRAGFLNADFAFVDTYPETEQQSNKIKMEEKRKEGGGRGAVS